MYIVTIDNGTPVEVHNEHHKLWSGSVVKGINVIDSFTFSTLPDNPAFGNLHDYLTFVSVYNLAKRRYEFQGRVLCTSPSMDESGLITQEAVCESFMGFLCDSQQEYQVENPWTVRALLSHVIGVHNSQVDDYQKFELGTVWDADANLYEGIQRENTWDTIQKKLIDKHGGEIRFRVSESGRLILDYAEKFGEEKTTEIALSKNMKSITKEKDPSAFVTRLIPLGAKLSDDDEERVNIKPVNDGVMYIDDAEAIAKYGIHVGYVEFDDVTQPDNLLTKGRAWLKDNNKVLVKYSITALDLSLIGLDIDDFDVYNTHPIKNALLGIDDKARVTKKTINVCEDSQSSFEIGESFKTLSELRHDQNKSLGQMSYDIAEIRRNFVTNEKLSDSFNVVYSTIEQTETSIRQSVEATYAKKDALDELRSDLRIAEDSIYAYVEEYSVTKGYLDGALEGYAEKTDLDDFVTETRLSSQLALTRNSITASVEATYATQDALSEVSGAVDTVSSTVRTISGELSLKIDESELISKINAVANEITITSDHFLLQADGSVTASNLNIKGGYLNLKSPEGHRLRYSREVEVPLGSYMNLELLSNINWNTESSPRFPLSCISGSGTSFCLLGNTSLFYDQTFTELGYIGANGAHCIIDGNWVDYSGMGVGSDANLKHDIEGLDERYETFFDALVARRFKYNHGTSGRYHTGYITQEVQAALRDAGVDESEFAGIYTVQRRPEDKYSALRYGEFTALNTWQIQKLKAEIKELKERINAQ